MSDQRIMLIEDDPDDRDLTIRALKKHNVLNPVTVASNGAEALTMLFGDDHRDQGNPALILLDLKLPKVDGLEVLRRIRADQRTQLIPVLVLTSAPRKKTTSAPPTNTAPTATSASPSRSANSARRYTLSACAGSSSTNRRRIPRPEQSMTKRASRGQKQLASRVPRVASQRLWGRPFSALSPARPPLPVMACWAFTSAAWVVPHGCHRDR
jgi:CheY-like chemotaxis protein